VEMGKGMAPSRSCLRSPASLLESRVDLWKDRRFSPVTPPDRCETMLTSLAPLLTSILSASPFHKQSKGPRRAAEGPLRR
jgi:hypothetical protein